VTGLFQEDEEVELIASMMKLKAFSEGIDEFSHESDRRVRWIEIEKDRISLRIAPIYPGDFVRGSIVPGYQSVILTSATLSVAGDFNFISQVLGLKDAHTLSLQSPFDLKNRVVSKQKRIDLKRRKVSKNSRASSKRHRKKTAGCSCSLHQGM
jgi:Rad3-related DNA helicase